MSNMSYCRFRNTLADLKDCYDNWDSLDYRDEGVPPSSEELTARTKVKELCQDIVDDYGDGQPHINKKEEGNGKEGFVFEP